jgi:RNA polymerase sigma-70 factor (ECF subfamily)
MFCTRGTMTITENQARSALDRLAADLRPKLHRYCARMTGSVIDGEDVVQEALLKVVETAQRGDAVEHPEAWLFRIAHNTAVDFLRRRARQPIQLDDEALHMIPDPVDETAQRQAAAASLRTFMRLPTAHRSSVILADVLGYSLREVAQVMETSIPAVKSSLHRARERLVMLAQEPEDVMPPVMTAQEHDLLEAYISRFNARDFDAIRGMIADDVRLDLVGRTRMRGRAQVEKYFGNYAAIDNWELSLGFIDRRPAVLAWGPGESAVPPTHVVLLRFDDERIIEIRDYRYATYVMEAAEVIPAR